MAETNTSTRWHFVWLWYDRHGCTPLGSNGTSRPFKRSMSTSRNRIAWNRSKDRKFVFSAFRRTNISTWWIFCRQMVAPPLTLRTPNARMWWVRIFLHSNNYYFSDAHTFVGLFFIIFGCVCVFVVLTTMGFFKCVFKWKIIF